MPVPAGRTTGRVSALRADGHTLTQIARAAGRTPELISLLEIGYIHWISPATADAIALAELRLAYGRGVHP